MCNIPSYRELQNVNLKDTFSIVPLITRYTVHVEFIIPHEKKTVLNFND